MGFKVLPAAQTTCGPLMLRKPIDLHDRIGKRIRVSWRSGAASARFRNHAGSLPVQRGNDRFPASQVGLYLRGNGKGKDRILPKGGQEDIGKSEVPGHRFLGPPPKKLYGSRQPPSPYLFR